MAEMRRLRMVNRAADNRRAATDHSPPPKRGPMTPKEQSAFDSQQHYTFRDMPVTEQAKLNSELASMWEGIPVHLRDKARKMVS